MSGAGREAELQNLLSVALAQAINQQDRNAAAQIRETLRCLSLLDGAGTAKLVRSLGEEFRRRLVASTRNVDRCLKSLKEFITKFMYGRPVIDSNSNF